jgi:hypothetical protein
MSVLIMVLITFCLRSTLFFVVFITNSYLIAPDFRTALKKFEAANAYEAAKPLSDPNLMVTNGSTAEILFKTPVHDYWSSSEQLRHVLDFFFNVVCFDK